MSEENKTQLAIIGGGPGGYAAAFLAADLGLEVTLIDPAENPGGVCLYRGCIPSKALLHLAKLINESREAHKWGVTFQEPEIDLDKVRSWKESVINQLTGGLGQLSSQRKIKHIRARAIFKDSLTLEIDDPQKGKSELQFDYAVLATGSRPTKIRGLFIDSPRVMNSTKALELEDIPESLLIVGGGYIGLEMGTVYSALGSKISVVEMLPNLLPGADKDLVRVLKKDLDQKFDQIMLNTKLSSMKEVKNGIKVSFEGAEDQTYSKVLYSIGRTPNSQGIGLENTKVQIDAKGFVTIDQQNRTAEPTIFAIGDIVGQPMLAHKATHEGKVAAEVISGMKSFFDARTIPSVAYTDPEIAWMGITETEASAQNIEYEKGAFPWAASGRALSIGRDEGLTKVLFDKTSGQIIGAGIVGPNAGELIAEAVLALEMGANAEDIGLAIHPHPTLSETLNFAAEMAEGTITDLYIPGKK